MTEVPEHLLQRSRARRAALGLGGDEGGAPVPATTAAEAATESAAAPVAPTPAPVVEPEPAAPVVLPPYVEAAKRRKKIPVWALPVVAFTPIWVLIFALTLDEPTPQEPGPLALGAATYASCSACHGGGGEGGVGPQLSEGATVETFENFADQLHWVMEGSDGFKAQGLSTYGDQPKPIQGGMPGWGESLTAEELLGVVRHERESLSGEAFDPKIYDETLAMVEENYPDRLAEFEEAIESWKDLPEGA